MGRRWVSWAAARAASSGSTSSSTSTGFQDWLQWFGGKVGWDLQVWNPEVYAFERIPNQVQMFDVLVILRGGGADVRRRLGDRPRCRPRESGRWRRSL